MPRRDDLHHSALVASSAIITPDHRTIDLYCFRLDRLAVSDVISLPDEKAAAGRFQVPRAADRFLIRRAILRSLVADLNGLEPSSVDLVREGGERPSIAGLSRFHFNTSHSEDLFLVASSFEAVPGIDVELERPIPDLDSLLPRICSPTERDLLQETDSFSSSRFLEIWTRKEAVLKALGLGLRLDPAGITVPCSEGPLGEWTSASVDDPSSGLPGVEVITPTDLPDGILCSLAVQVNKRP